MISGYRIVSWPHYSVFRRAIKRYKGTQYVCTNGQTRYPVTLHLHKHLDSCFGLYWLGVCHLRFRIFPISAPRVELFAGNLPFARKKVYRRSDRPSCICVFKASRCYLPGGNQGSSLRIEAHSLAQPRALSAALQ